MRPIWFYFFARYGLLFLSIFIVPFLWLYSLGKRKPCPPIEDSLLLKSATKLAHMIRTKEVSCEKVIRVFINRIKDVNEITNAIVQDRFERAILEAIEVDKFIASDMRTIEELQQCLPLLGVPVTVKESIMVEGLSCNAGSKYRDIIGHKNGIAVQQIKNAGAIILCNTNTPENCLFLETFNDVTGVTRNPYNTTRTPGGSSGGEAALIGGGASVIGIGTDLAGSLRLPASFSGIYTHKPSPFLISNEGLYPLCFDPNFSYYHVCGPLTRYIEDLPLMLSLMADPNVKNIFNECDKVNIKDLKVFYMEREYNSIFTKSVDRNILNAMRDFANYLQATHKIQVEKVEIADMCHSFTRSCHSLMAFEKADMQFFDKDYNFRYWKTIWLLITCRIKMNIVTFMTGSFMYFQRVFLKNKKEFIAGKRNEMKKNIAKILGDNGVLLYPTWPNPAPYHFDCFRSILDIGYVAVFNILQMPVTNVPAGLTKNGLPIGFQIAALNNNDHLTLAVAKEADKFFGGWKPPIN